MNSEQLIQIVVALLGALQAVKIGKWGYKKAVTDRVPRADLEEEIKSRKAWHDQWVKSCREKGKLSDIYERRFNHQKDVIEGLKRGLARSRGIRTATEITNTGAITATQAQTHEQS